MSYFSKKSDGIIDAFKILEEEITSARIEINTALAGCINSGDHKKHSNLSSEDAFMRDLIEDICLLKKNYIDKKNSCEVKEVKSECNSRSFGVPPPPKTHNAEKKQRNKKKQIFSIRFSDGTQFSEDKASITFVMAIEKFGIDRVRVLGLRTSGIPLITHQKSTERSQYQSGSYWITTHSNTEDKCKLLKEIAGLLNEEVVICLVSPPI
jgi:hypothetical protein